MGGRYGEGRGSIAAFLFRSMTPSTTSTTGSTTSTSANTNTNTPSYSKLRKVGGASLAQIDNPESGPMFGADSFIVPLSKENPKFARSKLGSYYDRYCIEDSTNAGTSSSTIDSLFGKHIPSIESIDLKVYHGIYKDDEYIPFTDAEHFALY